MWGNDGTSTQYVALLLLYVRSRSALPRALRAADRGAIVRAGATEGTDGRNARHANSDLAARRAGGHRRLRQPLLPAERRQAAAPRRRPLQPRAALGHLQRRARGLEGAAGMACLAASHGQRGAAAAPASSLGKAAPAQPDRHAARLSPPRLRVARRPASARHRRLRAADTGISPALPASTCGTAR